MLDKEDQEAALKKQKQRERAAMLHCKSFNNYKKTQFFT